MKDIDIIEHKVLESRLQKKKNIPLDITGFGLVTKGNVNELPNQKHH